MSSALIFARDGRTLPFVPVTIAALDAIRDRCAEPRQDGHRRSYPHALATYMALLELSNARRADRVAITQKELAGKAGASRSGIQAALGDLRDAGVLRVFERSHGAARIENEYVVIEPTAGNDTPAFDESGGRLPGERLVRARPSPPSGARLPMEEEEKEARERTTIPLSPNERTVRFKGRSVPSPMLDRAVTVLALYNDIFGRALKPFSATGEQAPHLTQILGKVIECPDMETADFERVLRAVHANPPGFLDGQPVGLGDIFGPRAWTRALENSGRALAIVPSSSQPVRHDRYSDKRQREIEREEAAQRVLAARQLREDQ